MRRIIALALAAAAVSALFAGPAVAGKSKGKHVSGSFGATLAPFPKLAAVGDNVGLTKPGCTAGQEGVNWVAQEFTSPGKGTLRFYAEGFTGDWDLYIFQDDLVVGRGDHAQVGQELAPPEEEILLPMTKGQTVTLAACNWFGDPNVTANFEGHFK
jgi:hypothetical protein